MTGLIALAVWAGIWWVLGYITGSCPGKKDKR